MASFSEKLSLAQIRAELQRIILATYGDDLPPIPEDIPILEMGISSLELVEGMRRVYDRFGVLVSIRRVVEGQITFGSLALYIEEELNNPQPVKKVTEAAPKEWAIERSIPLAPSQQHLAFLARYSDEAGAAFNESVIVRLRGAFNGPALLGAIREAGNRHQALRTALDLYKNALNLGAGEILEPHVASVLTEELEGRLAEIVSRPFEIGQRLFRAELLRISETEHILVLVGHSLVMEQQAFSAVLDDTARLYSSFARGEDTPAFVPTLQWTDYLAMGETAEAKQAQEAAESHWKEVFASGAPRLELPADHPRPAIKKYSGARRSLALDPDLEKRLRRWAEAEGVSPEMVLYTAFAAFLHRFAPVEHIVVGVESQPLYTETGIQAVAPTRNMLPVKTGFDPEHSFRDYVRNLADLLTEANNHRLLSLAELIQLLDLARNQSRSPLFSTAFRSRTQTTSPAFDGLKSSYLPSPSAGARYDLELIAIFSENETRLVCDYSTELFDGETISRWLDGIAILLDAALEDAHTACGVLPIMGAKERELLINGWNQTEKVFPADQTVFDLIIEQSEIQYEQTAVQFGNDSLTYGALLKRTDEIAAALYERGVGQGDRVSILMRRSLDLVPAMLATWRIGATYVPLDIGFPKSRIAYMLEDANAKVVITNNDLTNLLDDASNVLCIEDVAPPPSPPIFAENGGGAGGGSAYVIYTSGSTGKPKGVEIRHKSLVNALLAIRDYVGFTPNSSMLALTTISFDVSTAELFMPLLGGGSVEIGEDGLVADGVRMIERFAASKPSHIQMTPSTWKMALAAGWRGDKELCILSCGEAISRDLAEQLIPKCRTIWNFYGPTETTVYSAAYQIESMPGKAMRIGRPFPNTQLYVLDERHQPVPVGSIGELYIGGDGLAAGYWQRPELTSERFIFSPFRSKHRLYRTGDLARYLPDGNLICLGRVDDQVKIHGVRVELGEIEAALRSLEGVHDAVATSWLDPRGDTQLVGHIIPDKPDAVTAHEVRVKLRERLPEVMIPPHILFAERFPLTANGKVRRASLPTPSAHGESGPAKAPSEAPETETEKALANAWATVLDIDVAAIGRDSDFMELGGHSLLITLLMIEIRKLFKVSFSLREFFGASTLRQLAALIDDRYVAEPEDTGVKPLTRADQPEEWARQRMAFLTHEAQLPQYLAPARGMFYTRPKEIRTAFLTGATGFLGVYLVAEILKTTQADLYCLVRPKRGEDGKDRIEKQMRRYDVWPGDEAWQAVWDARLHIVEGDVTLPRLGMKGDIYDRLAVEVDAIFHSAAHVNFIYPYEALRATNVLGIHEIIQFAFHLRIKQVHHLSTAAIWPMGSRFTYFERDPIDHNGILNLGYDEAKWVGEKCFLNAEEWGLPVARYRPGEVGGDSVTGRCVTDHFVIACVKGFLQFGAFPDLDIEVDIAPVDYVAKAMVYLAFKRNPIGKAYHLTNPFRERLSDGLDYLRRLGYQFDVIPFEELRDRLLASPDFSQNALFAYQAALEDMNDISMQLPTYDTRDVQRELAGSGIQCAAADQKLFETYLKYLQKIEFIPQPEEMSGQKIAGD